MYTPEKSQFAEVSIDMNTLYNPDQYTRMPRELMLAQKVKRIISNYQAQGWQTVHINFEPNGAKLKFRRTN